MPLMQGKSKQAFGHNVGAEMKAGKPQKQALAIAYSMKRRNAKKMAKGGMVRDEEDMGRNHDPIRGEQMVQDNEALNPMNEPEHGAEDAVMKQMNFSKKAQEHEDLEESKVDPGSTNAYRPKTMPLRSEPKIAQADLSLAEQGAHFASGGKVGEAIDRRQRAIMAAMGKLPRPENERQGDTIRMKPAMGSKENAQASRSTGPSGMTTPIYDKIKQTYPDTNLSEQEQAALMATGGLIEYPDPDLSMDEQDSFYADGGMTGNEISSPRNQVAVMKEGYGEYPYNAKEDEGEHMNFAHGNIVKAIMKKKMYAEGGPVDEMGLQDQEYDTDRFMAEHMEPSHYDHLTHEDISDEVANDNPKPKRKMMLSKIMRNLHGMHLGK